MESTCLLTLLVGPLARSLTFGRAKQSGNRLTSSPRKDAGL
jgi:hypothetical protein